MGKFFSVYKNVFSIKIILFNVYIYFPTDPEDFTEEEKCENLMNIVVESRKRFGKMCVDYEHKTSAIENKILKLQLETIFNFQFKPKHPIPVVNTDDMLKDIDDFVQEIHSKQKRVERIEKKLKDTQEVVAQIKRDEFRKVAKEPLTAEVILARAKAKLNSEQLWLMVIMI